MRTFWNIVWEEVKSMGIIDPSMRIFAINNETGKFFFDLKYKPTASALTLTDFGLSYPPKEEFLEIDNIKFKVNSEKNPEGDFYSLQLEIL